MRGSARFYAQYAFSDKNHGKREILLAALDGRLGERRQIRCRIPRLPMEPSPDEVDEKRRPKHMDDLHDLHRLPAHARLVARRHKMLEGCRDAANHDRHQDEHERPEPHLEPMR